MDFWEAKTKRILKKLLYSHFILYYICKYVIRSTYILISRTAYPRSFEFQTERSSRTANYSQHLHFTSFSKCYCDRNLRLRFGLRGWFVQCSQFAALIHAFIFGFGFASGLLANAFTFHILYYLRFTFQCRCTNNELLSHLFEFGCVSVWRKMEWEHTLIIYYHWLHFLFVFPIFTEFHTLCALYFTASSQINKHSFISNSITQAIGYEKLLVYQETH